MDISLLAVGNGFQMCHGSDCGINPVTWGGDPGKVPCNPTNHQQMPLLATRQNSGILDCSVAELEFGTLRTKAYTLRVVYSRQVGGKGMTGPEAGQRG